MKKLFTVLALSLLLVGCDNYTVEELKKDPELRNKILKECGEMGPQKAKETKKCQVAREAFSSGITDLF